MNIIQIENYYVLTTFFSLHYHVNGPGMKYFCCKMMVMVLYLYASLTFSLSGTEGFK